jgi:hypothetical protein
VDNEFQAGKMKTLGIFSDVHTEIGQIIVAQVSKERVAELLRPDRALLGDLIRNTSPAVDTHNGAPKEESDELIPSGD